ncbi:MAG: hypothetical protein H0T56_11660 [Pseudaminobacter sp.]|nr:hypothetical protein [Pseudaminobacter sp.]
MRIETMTERGRMHVIAGLSLLAAAFPGAHAGAQGLNNEQAIETIIGSEVVEEEKRASANTERLIAAIENTGPVTREVQMKSSLDKVDIVYLADAAEKPPAEIDAKIKEHADEIASLRKEIEGNAMLFHAVDSRSVLMRDILAIEFDDANGATIYVTAKPAGG